MARLSQAAFRGKTTPLQFTPLAVLGAWAPTHARKPRPGTPLLFRVAFLATSKKVLNEERRPWLFLWGTIISPCKTRTITLRLLSSKYCSCHPSFYSLPPRGSLAIFNGIISFCRYLGWPSCTFSSVALVISRSRVLQTIH